jgi:putative N6-adenine-specific DNA methylase
MDIFLITAPGLEGLLADEARERGFSVLETIPGGVTVTGNWPDVWRANLTLRGATRVLARIGEFRAMHLAQLDKRSKKFSWGDVIPKGATVKVEATCRKSKIYHAGAAQQRVEDALKHHGATISKTAEFSVRVRIEDDLVTFSLDTSGESLHKRGHKEAVNKAPMRETLASLFLRGCGYDGNEPVYDPMCGSGTFPIEAAEIAMAMDAGRSRGFAFQDLASYDATAFAALRSPPQETAHRFYGTDRDAGAIRMCQANAERADVTEQTDFQMKPISDITPPCTGKGLIIANPPYGGRIGNKKPLYGLYASLGERLKKEFKGWRVGIITSEQSLAKATGLPFKPVGPVVNHGGIKIRLWQTDPLH